MTYLDWDIDTSIFGICSPTTLPSHYSDFMRQPWGEVGRPPHLSLGLGIPLGLGLGVPLGWGRGWRRSDTDDFGADLRAIPRERGGILHCRRKIFSVVVSVLFRGKCMQL